MWSYILVLAAAAIARVAGEAESAAFSMAEMSWGGPETGCAGGAAPGGRQAQCALPAGRVTLVAGAAALSLECEDGSFSCAELEAARPLLPPQPPTLRSLSLRGCSPGADAALACVLALVNATGAARVALSDARSPLRPAHLRHLTGVRSLRLSVADKIEMNVPYDALAELPELESFALLMATVTLDAGAVGASAGGVVLPRLTRLEVAGGALRSVPAAAFRRTPALTQLLLWGNGMTHIHADALLGLAHLQTLSLNSNALPELPRALLRPTPALRTLHAYGNALADLPADLLAGLDQLEEVKIFNNNASLEVAGGALAALPALRRVTLESSNISRLRADTLGASPLRALSLARNRLAALPADLFAQQGALQTLDLSYNALAELPRDLLAPLANLTDLTLRSNNLTHLDRWCFSGLASLVRLDLSANMLISLRADTFDPLQQLQVLSVAHNSLQLGGGGGGAGYDYAHGDAAAGADGALSPFRNLKRLVRLSLAHNRIAALAADWRLLTSLQALDLAYNDISEITDVDMEFLSNCTVDLRHNNISAVAAPPPAPPAAGLELRLADNPLVCDCRMFPLAAALRAAAPAPRLLGAACAAPPALAGAALAHLDPDRLVCSVAACPASCACELRPAARRLRLDCATPPAAAPRAPAGVDLVLRLTAPPPAELRPPPDVALLDLTGLGLAHAPRLLDPPPDLELDLRNNSLRRPPLEALEAGRGVLLAGNALACDCAARPDLLRLEPLRHLVRDLDDVQCAGGGSLAGVRVARLCAARDAAVVGGCAALAALGTALLLLWAGRRHRAALRRLLVKLGLAADRAPAAGDLEYDACVCYGPADAEWVWALVARLESAGLRLCVPERDWPPGAVISEQVARSAARARLTLAVVSGALEDAAWARLELAAAAAHGGALLLVREPAALRLPALRPHLPVSRRLRADDPRLAERLVRALRGAGGGGALGRVRLRPADLAPGDKPPELVLQVSQLSPPSPADVTLLFDAQKPPPAAAAL